MISIDASYQNLIGDALCAVPYMAYLCEKHQCSAFVHNGFNALVRELVADYPFVFAEPTGDIEAAYELDLQSAWQLDFQKSWPWHMTQIYFAHYQAPIPRLPVCFPMRVADCGLPPGIVITPFSRTNSKENNKFWPHDRWIGVIRHLLDIGCADRAYVLGASSDDFLPYLGHADIQPVVDRPLPEVLDLLRKSVLVLGHDNGISHLCHVGGVDRHIMIYANCLPPRFAENPLGVHVRAPMPADISVYDVASIAKQFLAARYQHPVSVPA